MAVKYAQWKENNTTSLEAPKDKQAVSSVFSTKPVFTLVICLRRIPFQMSHTAKQLNHSVTY